MVLLAAGCIALSACSSLPRSRSSEQLDFQALTPDEETAMVALFNSLPNGTSRTRIASVLNTSGGCLGEDALVAEWRLLMDAASRSASATSDAFSGAAGAANGMSTELAEMGVKSLDALLSWTNRAGWYVFAYSDAREALAESRRYIERIVEAASTIEDQQSAPAELVPVWRVCKRVILDSRPCRHMPLNDLPGNIYPASLIVSIGMGDLRITTALPCATTRSGCPEIVAISLAGVPDCVVYTVRHDEYTALCRCLKRNMGPRP